MKVGVVVPHNKTVSHANFRSKVKVTVNFFSKSLLVHNFAGNGWIWMKLGTVVPYPISRQSVPCENSDEETGINVLQISLVTS